MNKLLEIGIISISVILTLIIMVMIIHIGTEIYCDSWGDKYFQDSYCFDIEVRCEIECLVNDENYTGIIENGCMCQCEKGEVNYCSGFYYPRDELK